MKMRNASVTSCRVRRVLAASLLLLVTSHSALAQAQSTGSSPVKSDTVKSDPVNLSAPVTGRRVPTFVLPDTSGKTVSIADFSDAKCVVVVFMGTQCPIGNAYAPDLAELQRRYQDQGVQLIGINSNLSDTPAAIAKHAKEFKIDFPILVDRDQLAVDIFGAQRTPEAFVLDHRRQIRYQGRIDDRVGYTFKRDKPRRADLEEAIKELIADKPVSIATTELQGCLITRSASLQDKGEITYAKHVAPILQNRCANCHHPGTAAPFSLLTHDDARNWSEMIKETVVERRMPPWDIDPRHGRFSNDLRMTKAEIDTLVAWIDGGSPFGDKKDLPPPRRFEDGWSIGAPDVVLKMPEAYTVQAKGTVAYKYFVTPTNFEKDMWVQASEAKPGNRAVVHHIIAFIRPKGVVRNRGLQSIGGFAPGEEPQIYPLGVGRKVPAGADIVWQVHYTPTGKVEKDRSELGLIFCKEPPKQVAHGGMAIDLRFKIPAHAQHHKVVSRARFAKDAELLSLMPHMHLRGKDFRYTARYPDGREEVLLNIPNYDFNWQHRYRFEKPLRMPRGTVLECVAHFDNSADNPANPDPSKPVRWGDQTWEEMMIGFYAYVDAEPVADPVDKPVAKPAEKPAAAETVDESTAAQAKALDTKPETKKPEAKTKPDDKKSEVKERTTEAGRILRRTYDFKAAGKEMEYALYLPKEFDAKKSYPLIVALHGLYSNPRQILGYPGFTKAADKYGYILAAPMGYNNRGWYGNFGTGGGRGNDPKNLGELSEKDVMNVLKIVRDEFQVDDQKIYLYGHSMGGGGSLHLAMKYPDIWAAIAPMAPAARRSTAGLEKAKHIPAFVVQGDKDRLVPVAKTRRWVEKMKELKMDVRYIEVKGGDHVFVAFKYFDEIFQFFDAHPKKMMQEAAAIGADE